MARTTDHGRTGLPATHQAATVERVRNLFRAAISLFIVVLMVTAAAGWFWTGTHQTRAQAAASHIVLGLAMLAGIAGLAALWRRTPGPR